MNIHKGVIIIAALTIILLGMAWRTALIVNNKLIRQASMCPTLDKGQQARYDTSYAVSKEGILQMTREQRKRYEWESKMKYIQGIAGLKALRDSK